MIEGKFPNCGLPLGWRSRVRGRSPNLVGRYTTGAAKRKNWTRAEGGFRFSRFRAV